MALPVYGNSLTLLQIQNEFGGANSISLSEYYANGSYVLPGTVGYPSGGSAVAIPTSGTISVNNFFGASKGIVGPATFDGVTQDDTAVLASTSVEFRLMNNGVWNVYIGGTVVQTGNWYSPTTTGIGSNFYAKATVTYESSFGDAGNSGNVGPQLISLGPDFGVLSYSNFNPDPFTAASDFVQYTIEISTNSDGTNVVASGDITLSTSCIDNN